MIGSNLSLTIDAIKHSHCWQPQDVLSHSDILKPCVVIFYKLAYQVDVAVAQTQYFTSLFSPVHDINSRRP
jgi:hypothetical protein